MSTILSVAATAHVAVTGTAAPASAAVAYARTVRLYSNRHIHVSLSGAATVTDMPVNEFDGVIIAVPANCAVSVIKAAGETDGDVWVTEAQAI